MAIFGKSKKAAPPPLQFQGQPQLVHTSQVNLPGPYGNVPPQSPLYLDSQRPNTAPLEHTQYQPVHLTQNYYLSPPLPIRPKKSYATLTKLKLSSPKLEVPPCLPGANLINNTLPEWNSQGVHYISQGAALYDQIRGKFDAVLTQIDGEIFSGDERDLRMPMWQQEQDDGGSWERGNMGKEGRSRGMVNNSVSTAVTSTNYFAKVNLYANSRLPPDLPPLKLYIPTFPLLCLAAQYSERVYTKPGNQEKETHVNADWRGGTKAMVIKSVPMDDMNTIVFAIRGTQTFMDWAVNLNSAPVSPEGFLDDPGNLCHAGFLTVAKKMIEPVAARLEFLLQEDPSRCNCSLLITGHSAGGAVAALLYSHMLSRTSTSRSRLSKLTSFFKRIHCVTFGAPPVSLLPLTKPDKPYLKKSIFLSFVNEGDPVPRADKAYVRSLLDLYSSPAPGQTSLINPPTQKAQPLLPSFASSSLALNMIRPCPKKANCDPSPGTALFPPIWPVPEATLSNAGGLILLRSVERYDGNKGKKKKPVQERMDEGVVAQKVTDELLRGVIWGDPVCHMMKLYAKRIEVLAMNAVTGRS